MTHNLRNCSKLLFPKKTGLTLIKRNAAGGGKTAAHSPGIPFPPGPRQFEQAQNWYNSAFTYGVTAFTLLCYFSDWKVVCTYIPFYNGKFPPEEAKPGKEDKKDACD